MTLKEENKLLSLKLLYGNFSQNCSFNIFLLKCLFVDFISKWPISGGTLGIPNDIWRLSSV